MAAPDDPAMLDERQLVEQARTDAEAFARLYRHYLPGVHAFCQRRCGSRADADDLTAATFERALRGLGSFRWERGGFGAWLFRIAANVLIDHHRAVARGRSDRAQRAFARLAPVRDPGPDEANARVARAEDAAGPRDVSSAHDDALRVALASLHPRYQRVLTLRSLADLDAPDAAAACELSPAHFAVVLHRARAALRRALEGVTQ
ncbi:MAG: RNA polymerase sigma factor [Microthrixaceae bacterium]